MLAHTHSHAPLELVIPQFERLLAVNIELHQGDARWRIACGADGEGVCDRGSVHRSADAHGKAGRTWFAAVMCTVIFPCGSSYVLLNTVESPVTVHVAHHRNVLSREGARAERTGETSVPTYKCCGKSVCLYLPVSCSRSFEIFDIISIQT